MSAVCIDALDRYDGIIQSKVNDLIEKYEISKGYVLAYQDALAFIRRLQGSTHAQLEEIAGNYLQVVNDKEQDQKQLVNKLIESHKKDLNDIQGLTKSSDDAQEIGTLIATKLQALETEKATAIQNVDASNEELKLSVETAVGASQVESQELNQTIEAHLKELTDTKAAKQLDNFIGTMESNKVDRELIDHIEMPNLHDINQETSAIAARKQQQQQNSPPGDQRLTRQTSYSPSAQAAQAAAQGTSLGGTRVKRSRRTKRRRRY